MITQFSKYGNNKPEVDDYVAGNPVEFRYKESYKAAFSETKWNNYTEFLKKNIGKIEFFLYISWIWRCLYGKI